MKFKCLRSNGYKHDLISIVVLFGILMMLVTIGPNLSSMSILNNKNTTVLANESEIENQLNLNSTSAETTNAKAKANATDMVYLSDIPYMPGISQTAYSTIQLDNNLSGGLITVNVDGKPKKFMKGILAHANATVAYDLSGYDFDYLTAYLGVDVNVGSNGNGVRFEIHTSDDGENWTLKERVNNNAVFKGDKDAYFLKYSIKDVKYIKFVIQNCGDQSSDHSVLADAKLINEGYEAPSLSVDYIKTVEEYDEIIKTFPSTNLTEEQELILLQREFVNNATYELLQDLATFNSSYNEVLRWLMTDLSNLKLYVLGGKPMGNYYKALVQLQRLYHNYKDDFNIQTPLNYSTDPTATYGTLYKKMAFSLSLTHSANIGLWMNNASTPESKSDSVRRYAIIKYMHKNNLFVAGGVNYNTWFENYTVEEMRYVMANNIDDDSMLWLNSYVRELIEKEGGARLWPHRYISYVWPNYANPVYYAEENKDYFNELFSVRDPNNEGERIGLWDVVYTIPGGVDVPEYTLQIPRGTESNKIYKLWMNMRNKFGTGSVCGGISKTGANIRGVLGLPDAVVGQPGHAAHINYFMNSNGDGFWGIDNDVSGWAYTGASMLLGWATAPYASGHTGTYIPLAQEVINHEDTYEQSQMYVYQAQAQKDLVKKEELYRKALEIQPLNLNAWYGLILTYNASENKTEEQYYELAKEIAEALKYYPLPMYQMTNQIKPKLTSIEESYKFTLLQTRILKEASVTPNTSTEVLQPSITRLMGNFLLGQMDTSIATFSFDGEDAGKIVLSSRFDGNGVRWDYAIHGKGDNGIWGKEDFKEVSFSADEEHKLQLTKEEIASITSENDIYVHIVGVNYSDENLFKIDIQESLGLPSTLYANDLEDKLIAAIPTMMWKYSENDPWTYFSDEEPDLSGDRDVIVKAGATGVYLASTNSQNYHFTNNVQPNERQYIPISHLSIESVSSEATAQGRHATNIIDGNVNTSWHSAWNGSDKVKEIVIKLDEVKNVTALDYYPLGGGNGKIEIAQIYVSMDGVNYILAAETDWTYRNTADVAPRTIDFEPVKGQYIKIIGKKTQAATAGASFIAGAMFNFYENPTAKVAATFSFDGENGGKIVLNDSEYTGSWRYSLDGGATWANVTGADHQLTKEELNRISIENGIKIMLDGDSYEYSIKIKEGETLTLNPYVNDLENRLIAVGDVSRLEWKLSDETEWTSYTDEEPIVKGNKTLQVRAKATATNLPSNVLEYTFTEDTDTVEERYIPISHLSIHSYSTQSVDGRRPHYAPNAIDGNINTQWHTDFRVSIANTEAFISIKLDAPRYISAIDYAHMAREIEQYGYMKTGRIYVSEDGENWTEAAIAQDVIQDDTVKHISFDEPIYGQYVKVVIESHDNVFATAAMINVYEDASQVAPNVSVEYSTTNKTNESVVASVVSDKDITITNNNGSNTYTFDENGSFVFEYTDSASNVGTVTATVSWIDKIAPTGTIEYETRDVTNQNVDVTLVPSEEVTITNNNGSPTYTFTENGEFTFEFVDAAGNKGTATAEITWINKKAPSGTIKYDTTKLTNNNVVATLSVANGVTITNNGGSNKYTFKDNGEFTFEFVDQAGNRGTATAKVNWIDRIAPKGALAYSTKDITNKDVVVSLITDKITTVTNNNGSKTYTFTENGTFTFEFRDIAGNTGSITATVDWINKNAPVGTISFDRTTKTNKDVVATLEVRDGIKVTNNGASKTYVFDKNGTFTFEFVDEAGNKGTATATVDWIDKVAPTGEINYSIKDITNKEVIATLITSEPVTITNNGGSNKHTFTENGEFTFEFVDEAGNTGSVKAQVNWINKNAPVGIVSYDITSITNKNVVATLSIEAGVRVTNNNGSTTYTFDKNGEFTFEFVDAAGNKGSATAKVDWINKNAPEGTITYDIPCLTNKNVTATLNVEDGIIVTNNNGSKIYTFDKKGSFTFEFEDMAGNKGSATATVNWIDKVAPKGKITYDISEETEGSVTATLGFDEEVTITNNGGSNKYTFTHNGEFTFEFVDKAGNKGSATAKVDWIVNPNLFGKLAYSESSATNKDVIVTLEVNDGIRIINNGGKNTYTFTKNGEFDFVIGDAYGNTKKVHAKVDWIDKESPIGSIKYSLTTATSGEVIATLETNEEVTVTNNNGSYTYVFTENGSFVFEFTDKAGNKGTVEAKVNWIDKTAPQGQVTYNVKDLTNKDVTATLSVDAGVTITNNGGKNTYVFTENGSFVFEFIDELGNKGSAVAIVNWIDKEAPVGRIVYSITEPTFESVIVTLRTNEDVTITNNNGKSTYVFTKNGRFVFEFVDKAGNKGTAEAIVSWITEEPTEPDDPKPIDPKPEDTKPSNPEEPKDPVKPDETKPTEPSKPVNPKPTKPNNGGGSTSVGNNTGITSGNTSTTPSHTTENTTTTTSKVEDDTTTTTTKQMEEIKVPEDEEKEEKTSTGINYKIILGCLVVFLFFVSVLVKLYVRK